MYDLDLLFFYRNEIATDVFNLYKPEVYFKEMYMKDVINTAIDDASQTAFGTTKDYWVFMFFNPWIDPTDFGFKSYTNENSFLQQKLDYVYKQKLGTIYNSSQIQKVFDRYHSVDTRQILIPLGKYYDEIKSYILDRYRKVKEV